MSAPRTTKTGEIVRRDEGAKDPSKELRGLIKAMMPQLQMAIPKHITAERLARVAMTAITQNPKLAECSKGSFMACLLTAAQLGLEPNTPLGQAYLIPRRNKSGAMECTFQRGYQGNIDLAYRSGKVTGITADVVYEGDHLEYEKGLFPKLVHRPSDSPDRETRKLLYVYAIVRMRDSDPIWAIMSAAQVEAHRLRNESEKRGGFSPWRTDYAAMAMKTAINAALKYAPKSAEQQRAEAMESAGAGFGTMGSAVDDRIADAISREGLVIDAEYTEVPPSAPGAKAPADDEPPADMDLPTDEPLEPGSDG